MAPSFVVPDMTYVDNFGKTDKFFESTEVKNYIHKNKQYAQPAHYKFIKQNYENPMDITSDFDLLISQYAGFVSKSGKQYLKTGGILVANNSHADAGLAQLDLDFELIAVAGHTKNRWQLSEKNLSDYYIPKSGKADEESVLLHTMKGFAYSKTASNYIFRKVS